MFHKLFIEGYYKYFVPDRTLEGVIKYITNYDYQLFHQKENKVIKIVCLFI